MSEISKDKALAWAKKVAASKPPRYTDDSRNAAAYILEAALSVFPAIGEGSRVEGLRDDEAPMSSDEDEMTAAESVLAYLAVEVCKAPDDEAMSPLRAQEIIEARIRSALRPPPERRDAPEPVAWQWQTSGGDWRLCEDAEEAKRKIRIGKHRVRPLYASPQQEK